MCAQKLQSITPTNNLYGFVLLHIHMQSPALCRTALLRPPPNTIPHIPDLREFTTSRYSWLGWELDQPRARRLKYTATQASPNNIRSLVLLSLCSVASRESSKRTPGHFEGELEGLADLVESAKPPILLPPLPTNDTASHKFRQTVHIYLSKCKLCSLNFRYNFDWSHSAVNYERINVTEDGYS